ncbi:nuclear transport factor 2 family protein [Burkholderia sp. FERM BP-3421]|uniref:nuclear transport factor 2 family protein n=1 Tax=Burkholderia sp. FERM BP-3421 TaxID=1494466 RepID=UPI00236243A3|nr:nuclear transport factor 2 family protein [Burkholderia sp. FERM BP-3421]WDD92218.1 nuclear transport factor 2 family protein [Burkholderia sp. FERM BP-3421]
MQPPKHLHPVVVDSLNLWHRMVEQQDLSELASIVAPGAEFRSPMAFSAYQSAAALTLALNTVIRVLEDFAYHRQLVSDDGLSVVLEFSARVGERKLKGVDFIRFDAHGKIAEFEVMVRPLNALQALGAEMGARLGDKLPAYKAAT